MAGLNFFGWFNRGGALTQQTGEQNPVPSVPLVSNTMNVGADGALQISTVWACVELRASIIASLPLFLYVKNFDGQKELARSDSLYRILHDSPNARMTSFEFWRAMMMNLDLRGNAYARIDRDAKGNAVSMWPMSADQVSQYVMDDGVLVYAYTIGGKTVILVEDQVLHIKGLGNGTTGLSKLDFMRSTTDETAKAQETASKLFGANGKPSGILMIDKVLSPAQREAIKRNFGEMATASTGRLHVLEADMKYQQLTLSPEDQQLLESRKFQTEEICRWFSTPPVLIHHSNVTTWGSGVEQILDGFHKLVIAPLLKNIEQAIAKRVFTSRQRVENVVEFSHDALLRGNIKDRMEVYQKATQNGIMSRNEARQLENLPPVSGGDDLTAQINLAPISMLGKTGVKNESNKDAITG
jgi:HK97 family phage portal protein